ncbi:MAG: hypothetical protein LBB56_03425 [Chitinispirillales bacterium]|jgi:hypothetical protein|nr:hypothetical protein [Chitinispirillales bacterium]
MSKQLTERQKQAVAYFEEHLDEWRSNPLYKYKYGIIYDNKLAGIFDEFATALTEATAKYQQGSYIIQQIISEEDYSSFLYSATV